jgi:hypothetical protein
MTTTPTKLTYREAIRLARRHTPTDDASGQFAVLDNGDVVHADGARSTALADQFRKFIDGGGKPKTAKARS